MRRIVIKRRQLQHSSNNHTNPSPCPSPRPNPNTNPTGMQLTRKESQPGYRLQATGHKASPQRRRGVQRTLKSVTKPTSVCEFTSHQLPVDVASLSAECRVTSPSGNNYYNVIILTLMNNINTF
ncbi:hypothetical protein ACLKA6_010704 [Drosophila palustris]